MVQGHDPSELAVMTFELLKWIQAQLDRIEKDVRELKGRVSHLEEGQGQIMIHLGQQQVQLSQINARMDRFEDRLVRIETRLDIVEGPQPAA